MLIIGLSQCQCFVNFSCSDVVFANFLYRVAVFRAPWCPPQGGSMDLNYFYSRPYLTSPFIVVCLELPDFLRKTFSLGLESLFQSLGLKTPTQKSSTSSTFFFLFLSFLSLFFFFVSSAIWNYWVIKTKKELHKNCDQNKRLLVVDTCATLNPVDLEVTETPIILQVTHICELGATVKQQYASLIPNIMLHSCLQTCAKSTFFGSTWMHHIIPRSNVIKKVYRNTRKTNCKANLDSVVYQVWIIWYYFVWQNHCKQVQIMCRVVTMIWSAV